MAHITETVPEYRGQQILAMLAGWTPTPYPVHRALEAEAAEAVDISERDYAARVTFQRRAAR
jgi:hypothetical protein